MGFEVNEAAVAAYFERASHDPDMILCMPDKNGTYALQSCEQPSGDRKLIQFYQGRFYDVIFEALKCKEYWALPTECSLDSLKLRSNGRIFRIYQEVALSRHISPAALIVLEDLVRKKQSAEICGNE